MKVGEWEFSFAASELAKDGVRIKLEPQSSQVLQYLCERPGEVVSRDELLDAVWGRQSVSVQSVPVVISKLRSVFEDDKRQPNYIETITKRGYRLVAPVSAPGKTTDAANSRGVVPTPQFAAAAIFAILCSAIVILTLRSNPTPAPMSRTIYVADVANLTDDSAFNIVAAGASEILTMALGNVDDMQVTRIRRNPETNDWLNAELRDHGIKEFPLLTTSVVPCDRGYCMIMQLVEDQSGNLAWTHSFDIENGAFASRQSQAVRELLQHFGKVTDLPPAVEFAAAGNVEEQFLRAKFFWGLRGRENNMLAAKFARQAIEQDPNYVPAHALLAEIYGKYTAEYLNVPEPNTEMLAKEHLAFAVANGPMHPATLAARARIYLLFERRPDLALNILDQAVALGVDDSSTYQLKSAAMYLLGDIDGSLAAIDRAMALEYNSPYIEMQYIMANYLGKRYDDVVAVAERLDPEYSADFRKQVAASYYELGRHEASIELWIEEARALGIEIDDQSEIYGFIRNDQIADAYEALGERIGAAAADSDLSVKKLQLYLSFYYGPHEAPLDLLKTISISRDARFMLWIHRWPLFDRFADNEEFQAFLRRLPIAALAECIHPACGTA